jgi:hypothetical protein
MEGQQRVFEMPPIQHPSTVNLSDQVEFLGYDLHNGKIKASDTLLRRTTEK